MLSVLDISCHFLYKFLIVIHLFDQLFTFCLTYFESARDFVSTCLGKKNAKFLFDGRESSFSFSLSPQYQVYLQDMNLSYHSKHCLSLAQ